MAVLCCLESLIETLVLVPVPPGQPERWPRLCGENTMRAARRTRFYRSRGRACVVGRAAGPRLASPSAGRRLRDKV